MNRSASTPAALHPSSRPGRRLAIRAAAAVALVVSGVTHVPVTPEHLEEAPYIGVAFIVLTVACAVLAVAVLLSDSSIVWSLSAWTCGLAVVVYAVSRTVGLPQIRDDIGNWWEPLGVSAVLAELVTVALAAVAISGLHRRRAVL